MGMTTPFGFVVCFLLAINLKHAQLLTAIMTALDVLWWLWWWRYFGILVVCHDDTQLNMIKFSDCVIIIVFYSSWQYLS